MEPVARDSLFSTSTRANPTPKAAAPAVRRPSIPVNPLSAAAMRMPAYPETSNPWSDAPSSPSPGGGSTPKFDIDVQALAQQAMHRPQFAADEATEGEGDDYGGEADEGLLGQVDAMLEEESEGTGASSFSRFDVASSLTFSFFRRYRTRRDR
jgi:hypothetical protein